MSEADFANLREEMEHVGAPYCIAHGSFYDATYEHFSDFADACERFAHLTREVQNEHHSAQDNNLGFFAIGQAPITCLHMIKEIPF